MNSIFVYCELEGVQVAPVSQELLTKGRSLANQLGVKLEAIAIGSGLDSIDKHSLMEWMYCMCLMTRLLHLILQHHIQQYW